ncbi:hypothetical protein CR513_10852, partial [Mucuna pruriens]
MHKRIGEQPQSSQVHLDNDILNHIYGGIQSFQQRMTNLAITMCDMDTRMDQRFQEFDRYFEGFKQLFKHHPS